MISKAKSCPGGTALFNYVINDLKGYELLRNGLSGITPKELYSDMSIIQKQNLRCSNNTISIVLSPTIEDGSRMTSDQLKELTAGFLKELELDPGASQFIAFVHTENLKVYQNEMAKFGIQVLPTINKQGKIQGFRFIHQETGTNLKASEVDRNLGLNKLFANEIPSAEKALEKDQLVQANSLNTSALSSVLSQLAFDAGEIPDENSKRNRKRKGTSINR